MIRKCCICGKDTFDADSIVCSVCKPIYDGQDYLTVLNAVIHNDITPEEGRAFLQRLSRMRENSNQ